MADLRNGENLMNRVVARYFWLGVGCLLLVGCTLLPRESGQALEVEFEQVLPVGWHALGRWQPVNLDGDEGNESLLLFNFDSGQVGALIYDAELAADLSQPAPLLPRYFDETGELGHGVIAPPGTPADAITLHQVDGASPARELVIRGGQSHLTFVWWQGEAASIENDGAHRYGVTQLTAPGGFGGVDWDAWRRSPTPIESIVGLHPLDDYRARSYICRMVLHARRADLPGIRFRDQSQGLHFCDRAVPSHPFAPEGVVLAYLLWPRPADADLESLLSPGTTLPQLDAEAAFARVAMEQIEDIAAYATVPMRPNLARDAQGQEGNVLPTTPVCVELAEIGNPSIRRWVLFTLRYQPADPAQNVAERWTLSGALAEPSPLERMPSDYCTTILARNAP